MKILNLFKKAKKEKSRAITRTEALGCIPEKSPGVHWSTQEGGDILIEYPLALKPFFLSLAKKFNRGREEKLTKKLQLDETGSKVWLLMDGRTNVKAIITAVSSHTGLSRQEAELSVTTFLRELGKRGLIILK